LIRKIPSYQKAQSISLFFFCRRCKMMVRVKEKMGVSENLIQ